MPKRFTNNRLLDFAQAQSAQTASEAAFMLLNTELNALGAKGAVYGILPTPPCDAKTARVSAQPNVSGALTQAHTFFSYPEEYARAYMENGLIKDDPFARFCATNEKGLMAWHDPQAELYATQGSVNMLTMAADFGLEYGASIPLRDGTGMAAGGIGVALDVTSQRDADELLNAHRGEIELSAMLFHARFHDQLRPESTVHLSERELECLKWAAVGLLTKEIAFRLSLSEKTVEFHLRNAANRLNARNRTHAVARALVYGFITL